MALPAETTIEDPVARCVELETEIIQSTEENGELEARIEWFEEQHRLELRRRFGSKSEKIDPNRALLFDEAEVLAEPSAVETTIEEITYKRRKVKGKQDEQFADLPEIEVSYTLSPEEQICPQCRGDLHKMDVTTRRELTIIPAQVFVTEHVRDVYSCRHCQTNEIETPVKTASMPGRRFPTVLLLLPRWPTSRTASSWRGCRSTAKSRFSRGSA